MKNFINKYSDKIAFVLIIFNVITLYTNTRQGTLNFILFKNAGPTIGVILFIVSYYLAKQKVSKYSKITIGIIYGLLTILLLIALVFVPLNFFF